MPRIHRVVRQGLVLENPPRNWWWRKQKQVSILEMDTATKVD
jgi:hypothetical protein